MKPGPQPTPTRLKVLRGVPGKRALPKNEPTPPAGRAAMPKWLKPGRARTAWARIAPILEQMQVLTVADETALALLCDAIAEYLAARDAIAGKPTYKSDTAHGEIRRQKPEVAIAQDAWKRIRTMLQEFGLTPASRTRLTAEPSDSGDELEEFLRGSGN